MRLMLLAAYGGTWLDATILLTAPIPEEIEQLAELRWEAKKNKNWALADQYRNDILNKGYTILDAKDGYKIEKK